jgi:1,4-dihydroxy-2-naphthoate octaprenyltransferase
MSEQTKPEQVKPIAGMQKVLMASRAYSFPASIIPIIFGSVLALPVVGGNFNVLNFFLTLIGGVLIQVGTNVINDIYDFKKGIDKADEKTGIPHGGSMVLSMGIADLKFMKMVAFVSIGVATLIGIYLYTQVGPWILYLTAFGFLSAIFYTAAPVALKYKALGDLQVIISFGVGMTLGAYIVQTGQFAWGPIIYSIPLGLLIDAILHSNNIRDINFDGKFGVKTVPILIGQDLSIKMYWALLIGAYACLIIFVAIGKLTPFALLALITFPIAWKLMVMISGIPDEPQARFEYGSKHTMMTAQLNMQFGLTLIIGLLVAYFFFS